MAINIIEHGNREEPHEVTCEEYGCRFTHTREDCYWSRPLLTYIVHCPECNNEIWLGDIYE